MPVRYIGIDAHQQSCTLAVMGPSGRRCQELVVETNAVALKRALKGIAAEKHVCLEEGEYSEWLYELVEPMTRETVVVQPEKCRGVKNDSKDAWARADELRRGDLKRPVFKTGGKYRSLREAVRSHAMAVGDLVRTKNRLRAVWRSRGIQVCAGELYTSSTRAPWVARLPVGVRQRASILGDQLDRILDTQEAAEGWLLEEASKVPVVRLVETAPGIGLIRAAQIVSVVVTPHRFRTSRQFWSYSGLGIVTRSSSDWVKDRKQRWVRAEIAQTRGLNRNRHPMLKNAFKGAAMTVLQRMPDHPLAQHYARLLEETKPNLARLTIARRIAAAVLAMWKNQEVYDPDKQSRSILR